MNVTAFNIYIYYKLVLNRLIDGAIQLSLIFVLSSKIIFIVWYFVFLLWFYIIIIDLHKPNGLGGFVLTMDIFRDNLFFVSEAQSSSHPEILTGLVFFP